MNPLRRALALANMAAMGIEHADLPGTLRRWNRTQRALRTIAVARSFDRFDFEMPPLKVESSQYLYMSAHFGLYAHTLATVALQSSHRRLAVLIGEQAGQQEQLLQAIAHRYGCELSFIRGGFSLIKGARKAANEGTPLFMLIDVPWGVSDPTDGQSSLLHGTLRTRSAYFKLCNLLGLRPYLMLARSSSDFSRHWVDLIGEIGADEAVGRICTAIEDQPYLWDRWFDCQKFTVPGREVKGAIPFRAGRTPYALSLPEYRAFSLSERLYVRLRGELRGDGMPMDRFGGRSSAVAQSLQAAN